MALIIQNGKGGHTNGCVRALNLIFFATLFSLGAFGQGLPSCTQFFSNAFVHPEGLAEKTGNIGLTCTGGTSGNPVSTSLFVTLNTNVTNKLDATGSLLGISTTAGTSLGTFPTGAAPTLYSPVTLAISGIQYTVPTPNTTPVNIVISGIRAAVPSANGGTGSGINAAVVGTALQISGPPSLPVASALSPSLLDTVFNGGTPCTGSPAPATADFPGLQAAGTAFSTVRITEGFPNAFSPKDAGADNGVRLLVNLSGYSSNAQVYVPDAIVGNDGSTPTSAGAFGYSFNQGVYTPGSNQLYLVRVNGADAKGAGGTLAQAAPGSVTQVSLTAGTGYVVYEVVDSNLNALEFAQIPVFVAAPAQSNCSASGQTVLAPLLAPLSNVAVATQTDPVPRFVSATPGPDCSVVGDCGAGYFPRLQVDITPITLSSSSLGLPQIVQLPVYNSGSGQMAFTDAVSYPSGQTTTGWLTVTPSSATNNTTLGVTADPGKLAQGQYLANITVDAGSAGSAIVPVTFNVGPTGVLLQSLVNSASQTAGPVAPGSYATLYGQNLAGQNVQIVFNGYPARVVFDSAGQINLIVPPSLTGTTTAGVYATIDGRVSNTYKAAIVDNAPGVFNPGILNQNFTVNTAAQGASPGDIIQIFATGLTTPITGLTVNIGTQLNLIPVYAGPAPTIDAMEQINVQIPVTSTFSGNTAPVSVCLPGPAGTPLCSNSVNLFLK